MTNKKKIRFYIERKSSTFLLWFLTLVFLFISVKTSNAELIDIFKETPVENFLQQFPIGNEFLKSISIGFLISVIFYLIVVYLPEKRKRKDIEPFINKKCESLIWSSYVLINEILKKSNTPYEYKTLTESQFREVCKNVNPKAHTYKFAKTIDNITQNNLGFKIYNDWARIINEIEETIRLLPNIDSGILKRIFSLYNNSLRYMAKDLLVIDKLQNEDLSSWSEPLLNFYKETRELRDYYVLYSNNKFNNDPWK